MMQDCHNNLLHKTVGLFVKPFEALETCMASMFPKDMSYRNNIVSESISAWLHCAVHIDPEAAWPG